MRITNLVLCVVILGELAAGFYYLSSGSTAPEPPLPDLGKLDEETRQALLELREKAIDGDYRRWRNLGEGYLGTGYYAAAEACLRQAVSLNPQDLQSAYSHGFCLERTGYTTEAIRVLRQVAESPEADADLVWTCWYQVGRCCLRQEDVAGAEEAFRRIPDFAPATYQLCKLLMRTDRTDTAVPLVERLLEDYPNDVKLLQLLYRAARDSGNVQLAQELRDQEDRADYSLELEYGLKFLGSMNARLGLGSRLAQAMALKDAGTPDEQSAALQGALKIIRENQFWNYRSVFQALAELYVETGRPDKAREIIQEIREFSQDGPELLLLEGRALLAEGQREAAAVALRRALRMKPSVEIIDVLLEVVEDTEEKSRLRSEKLFRLGFSEYSRNNIAGAIAYLEAAVELAPTNARDLYYLGDAQRLNGQSDEARVSFEKCLQQSPEHGRAASRLQWLKQ